MAARSGVGRAIGILARAVARAAGAGFADRSPATAAAELSRSAAELPAGGRVDRKSEATEPARGSDVVHDLAGGLSNPASSLQWPGRHRGGDTDSESEPSRA